jgi:hypothetical protein
MASAPISNAITVGSYTAKTIGTFPTGWSSYNPPVTASVVGTGYETGIPYIDVNFAGTTAAGQNIYIGPSNSGSVSVGQKWTGSSYLRLVSGTLSGLSFFRYTFNEYNGGTYLTQGLNNLSISGITNATQLSAFRTSYTYTVANSSTNNMSFFYTLIAPAGTLNFTIRFGALQMELGAYATSPILTSGSAATRVYDSLSMSSAYTGSSLNSSAPGTIVSATLFDPVPSATNLGHVLWKLTDVAGNNLIQLYNQIGQQNAYVTASSAGVGILNGTLGNKTITNGLSFKHAISWTTGGVFTDAASGSLGSSSTQTLPTGFNTLYLGSTGNSNQIAGWLQRWAYYPVALSNTELVSQTS